MANWYGLSRTNYFRVKDEAAFRLFADSIDVTLIEDGEGRFGLLGNDEGYWPSMRLDEETDEYEDFELADKLIEHIADGEVAVLVTAGHEKARYATGYALAINNAGKTVTISINDIYEEALEVFGVLPTPAEY